MKKNIFKFGAALTAAMMVFSATASLAFADEADEVVAEPETVVSDVVEAPEADAEDMPADDAEEVAVPLETEDITAADIEAEVTAAAKADDVATGSVIAIGNIAASKDSDYYTVSVPFTVSESVPSQLSFFVYDITALTSGDQNNTVGFTSETPVGYINQYAGAASGTYTFKLSTANYTDSSIIVVKMGGTDVTTPDAKSVVLGDAQQGGDVVYGDVNGDGSFDTKDTLLVLQYGVHKIDLTEDQVKSADVNVDGSFDTKDTLLILQYGAHKIDKLPQPIQ